jgi:RHS repeat-associated protein
MVQAGQTSPCFDGDFLPFGQEVDYTSTCGSNYKFEGKERDLETGNDDFGARYYRSALGRWLSADWSSVPAPVPYANLTNPQTLNLYAMVSDNPETFADLDGHLTEGQGPYNLETADTSGGNDGQGHQCDYMGGDCSKNATQGAAATQAAQTKSAQQQNNSQNQQNNQDQNQQNQPIQMSGGKGGQGKGGRGRTAKPEFKPKPGKLPKGVRPAPGRPGRLEVWDKHKGDWVLKPPNWSPQTAQKVGIGAAIVTGGLILGRAIAACFGSGLCEAAGAPAGF